MNTNQDDLRRNWDGKARDWYRHIGIEGDRNRKLRIGPTVEDWLGNVENVRALDAGCGTGWMAGLLAEKGADVAAVDFSEEMVSVARESLRKRRLNVAVRVDDCTRLDTCPDNEFDLVTSIYAIQDLPDLDGAVFSFWRVLKPRGKCLLAFSHPCFDVPGGPVNEDGQTVYRWTGAYFPGGRYTEYWPGTDHQTQERFSFAEEFVYFHRPLRTYWKAFRRAGFDVLELDEPFPEGKEATAVPFVMMVLLLKT